jgi:coenzyme F420-reducing hydrogenase alpha subunit
MDKIIEICTRVEGHGNLNFIFKGEELSHTEFTFSLYRGFENILIGKKLCDVPKIVSRICGLCNASQTIASCKAIEDIYGIEPSIQSILLRKLLMTSELMKSHLLHFFYQTLPDLLEIFNLGNKPNTPYAIFNYNDQITTKVYNLLKIGSDINRLVGGRVIHPITVIPGGIINNPEKKNLLLIQKYLKRAKDYAQDLIEHFIALFSKYNPPIEYDLSKLSFLGLSNDNFYSRYEGNIIIKQLKSKSQIFEPQNYQEFFDKSPELYGINFHNISDSQILTGPYSRFNIKKDFPFDIISEYVTQFEKPWKNNLLFMNFLQLVEILLEILQNSETLDDDFIHSKWSVISLKNIKNRDGIGVLEAPRGLLLHHYHIDKYQRIDSVKLFIATEINLPIINEMIGKYAQELLLKYDINTVKNKVQQMLRAFDPCISCLSH